MSFRLFAFYCGVCGAWSAFLGWMIGTLVCPSGDGVSDALRSGLLGLFLGMFVAVGLSLLDLYRDASTRIGSLIVERILIAVSLGSVGGLLGGLVGQQLYGWTQQGAFFVFGWALVGILVGAAAGSFEYVAGMIHGQTPPGAWRKLQNCLIGGTAGGTLGGVLALVLRAAATVFADKDQNRLLSPTALGFVALGACIGLFIGLAQIILKEAWIRVEAGFRPGRELILAKERTTIGRAEQADIALFGDGGVEKVHAHIVLREGRYHVEDTAPGHATYVNDKRISGQSLLASGDRIRVGRSVLRFSERQKS